MKNKFLKSLFVSFALAVSGIANAGLITYNGTGGAIPPSGSLGTFSSTINISDNYLLSDLTITLNNLNHSFVGDLQIFLSHNGTTVDLVNNLFVDAGLALCIGVGSCAADYNGSYSFNDLFVNNLWDQTSGTIASGNYFASTTEGAVSLLSAFSGSSVSGDWILTIDDQVAGDSGSLGSWELAITSATDVPEPSTLAIFALGLMGLASRKFKKQA